MSSIPLANSCYFLLSENRRKLSNLFDHTGEIFGTYRLIQKLGSGGFAQVYKGEHILLAEVYAAVKILISEDPSVIISHEDKESFLQEARAIGRLDNPHVIHFKDFAIKQPDAIPFIAMDYLPNGSLRDKHPRGSILSPKLLATYVEQIAAGLQHAHDHKIVHRDIKPENILFNQAGEIVVSDFGIAVEEHNLQSVQLHPQIVAGTFAYTAPEQFAKKATARSDQYALAIMVYEMLIGRTPFVVAIGLGDTQQIARQYAFEHISINVPPMVGVPKEVADVVLKALSKNPNDRFSTITDFSHALAQAVSRSTTILQKPTSVPPFGSSLPPTVYPVKPNKQVLPPTVPAVPQVKKPSVPKAVPVQQKHKVKIVPPSPQWAPKAQVQQRQVFQYPRRHNPQIRTREFLVILAVILFFLSVPVSIIATVARTHGQPMVQSTYTQAKLTVTVHKSPVKTVTTPTPSLSPTPTIVSIIIYVDSQNTANDGTFNRDYFNINVPYTGMYHLTLNYYPDKEADKVCSISVNNGKMQNISLLQFKENASGRETTVNVYLNKGNNTINVYPPQNLQYPNEAWLNFIEITDLKTPIV